MKQTCYIAGPISALQKNIYEANFAAGKVEAFKLGYVPISPLDLQHSKDASWKDCMKTDIKKMLECDAVYALKGWHKSQGASIEIHLAGLLQISIIFQP